VKRRETKRKVGGGGGHSEGKRRGLLSDKKRGEKKDLKKGGHMLQAKKSPTEERGPWYILGFCNVRFKSLVRGKVRRLKDRGHPKEEGGFS